jgi:hypothetical protein
MQQQQLIGAAAAAATILIPFHDHGPAGSPPHAGPAPAGTCGGVCSSSSNNALKGC